jgi:hypothetical protein
MYRDIYEHLTFIVLISVFAPLEVRVLQINLL